MFKPCNANRILFVIGNSLISKVNQGSSGQTA